jgi:hypothetical protein
MLMHEEIVVHLELEENKNVNRNHHYNEKLLFSSFIIRVFQQIQGGPHGGHYQRNGNNHVGSFEGAENTLRVNHFGSKKGCITNIIVHNKLKS